MIDFRVQIKPIAKQRPRFANNGVVYTPSKTINYEKQIKKSFNEKYPNFKPLEAALIVELTFYFQRAKSNKLEHFTMKPDIDNLIKSVCDALNNVVYLDDKQIVGIIANKQFDTIDGVKITIKELE